MYYILLAVMVLLDQISKIIVRNTMSLHESFSVIGDLFRITYIENRGIAFSMFSEGRNEFVLLVMPVIIIIGLFFYWKKSEKNYGKPFSVSIMMIIAGGLSNLIDRLMYRSVTDFFDLKWFAIFNIADIFAVAGCILLVVSVLFFEKNGEKNKEKEI